MFQNTLDYSLCLYHAQVYFMHNLKLKCSQSYRFLPNFSMINFFSSLSFLSVALLNKRLVFGGASTHAHFICLRLLLILFFPLYYVDLVLFILNCGDAFTFCIIVNLCRLQHLASFQKHAAVAFRLLTVRANWRDFTSD